MANEKKEKNVKSRTNKIKYKMNEYTISCRIIV